MIPILNIDLLNIDISKINLENLSTEPDKYTITNLILNKDGSYSCEATIHDKDLLDAITEGLMVGCSSVRSNENFIE